LPDVRGERPHVRVTIDWQALCAERGAAGVAGGELGWAGPITPKTARRLACDAGVVRVINGALLCERHHTACHEGGFAVSRDPGTNGWHTYRPDGTGILSRAGP
jgi:hypothetical protein